MIGKYLIRIILLVIGSVKFESICAQSQANSDIKEYDNKRRDFNRILGDIAYSDDYEVHWGLAVVAILPLIAILIAILIWKFCKTGPNDNTEAGSDQNNKRSFSHEESSY